MIVIFVLRLQRQNCSRTFLRTPAFEQAAPDVMRNRKKPAFKLLRLAQVLQSFIDGNKRLLGEVAALFRVKSFAPEEAQHLSVVALKEPVEVSFYIQPLLNLAD